MTTPVPSPSITSLQQVYDHATDLYGSLVVLMTIFTMLVILGLAGFISLNSWGRK